MKPMGPFFRNLSKLRRVWQAHVVITPSEPAHRGDGGAQVQEDSLGLDLGGRVLGSVLHRGQQDGAGAIECGHLGRITCAELSESVGAG